MRKIYKIYICFIESLPGIHHYYKMYIAERIALWKKRKLIKNVKWDKNQKAEFKDYWKSNYKKINSRGNKLFEAFNGVYHKDYVPDFLYATKIESYLNYYQYARIYSDKALTEILYKHRSKALIPETYLLKAGGVFYDNQRNVIDLESAKEILLSLGEVVIKPTVDGNSGKGVMIGNFNENQNEINRDFNMLSLLDNAHDNIIVQEKVIQSYALNNIFPFSVNTFRVMSYILNNEVHIGPLSLRMGSGESKVDNIHAGGLAVGVDLETESLKKYAYKLGYSDSTIKFKNHPDTNILFEGYKVKGIKTMIESARKLHGFTPHIGIISWDFTINSNNIPILIEANYIGQSVWFSQIVNGTPFFDNKTLTILKNIK